MTREEKIEIVDTLIKDLNDTVLCYICPIYIYHVLGVAGHDLDSLEIKAHMRKNFPELYEGLKHRYKSEGRALLVENDIKRGCNRLYTSHLYPLEWNGMSPVWPCESGNLRRSFLIKLRATL